MPRISQLPILININTGSIIPVVDNSRTQRISVGRLFEFLSGALDETFTTEFELMQSASAITSSFEILSSSLNTAINNITVGSASIPAGTISSSNQIITLGFAKTGSNTFNGSQTISNGNTLFVNRIENTTGGNIEIAASGLLSLSGDGGGVATNDNFEANPGGNSTFKVSSGSISITGSIYVSGTPIISGATQITNLGFATTSSVVNVNTSSLVTTASFNEFSTSINQRVIDATNEQILNNLATTASNTFSGSQTILAGNSLLVNRIENTTGGNIEIAAAGLLTLSGDGGGVSTNDNFEANPGGNATFKVTSGSVSITGSIRATGTTIISSSTQITALGFISESITDTGSLLLTSSFNSYTTSINNVTSALVSKTGSYAATGSNTFVGNQIISGSITLDNGATIQDNENSSIAFGKQAAEFNQGTQSVAIGIQAAEYNQGNQSVAVGQGAGNYNQNNGAVAVGANAGAFNQGLRATAIGSLAGGINQGEYAVALGNFAGGTDQAPNSIVINATGTALNNTTTSSLKIAPIRNITGSSGVLQYNDDTKEVSYSNIISGSTTFVGNQTIIDGNIYGNESAIILSTGQTSPAAAITVDISEVTIAFAGGAGKEWNIFSDGNTTYNGNLNGVLNLATTGSNTFRGTQAISGSTQIYNNLIVTGSSMFGSGTFNTIAPEKFLVIQDDPANYNIIVGEANTNNYSQIVVWNKSNGISASSDIIAQADNGGETNMYADLGVNSSNFTGNGNGIGGANDAYVYGKAKNFYVGNLTTQSLYLFANESGSPEVILHSNILTISASVLVSGSISASSYIGLPNGLISSSGVISSSTQVSNFGFASTSSLAVVTPFLSSSTFNTFTSSVKTDSSSFDARITEIVNTGTPAGTISSSVQITTLGFATTGSLPIVTPFLSASIFNTFVTSSNTFTASVNTTTASFNTFSSSINTFTSSTNLALNNLYTSTSSLNSFSASVISSIGTLSSKTGSYATTGSNTFTGTEIISGTLIVEGTISASALQVTTFFAVSSSVSQTSGSTAFGTNDTDVMSVTGSVRATNEISASTINGLGNASQFSSSLSGRLDALQTSTSSLNSFSASVNNTTNSINSATASLNTFTSSINTTIKTRLSAEGVISGSSQVLNGSGIYSSSAQLPSGLVSGSSQILNSSNILSSSAESFTAFSSSVDSRIGVGGAAPAGTISSSQQITNLGFATTSSVVNVNTSSLVTTSSFNTYTSSISNAVSAAINVATSSLSSSVASINATQLSTASFNTYSSSINNTTASLNRFTASAATTASNTFIGNQTISGSVTVTSTLSISSTVINDTNLFASSSSLILTSGSALIINSGGYANITGSVVISGSLNVNGVDITGVGGGGSTDVSMFLSQSIFNTFTTSSNTFTSSVNSFSASVNATTSSLNTFTSSINTTIKSKLNTDGVISGSSQILNGSGIWSGSSQLPLGIVSGSTQITEFGFATTSSLLNIDTSSLVTTSSFNSYTSSNESKWNTLGGQTGSFITEAETSSFVTNVSMFLSKSAFDIYTSSLAGTISSSQQITNFGFATTGSLAVVTPFLSSSIFNTFATSSNTFTESVNATTSSLNTFTSSINTTIKNRLNAEGVFSSSLQLPSGLVSGSSQVLNSSNILSSSAQSFTAFSSSVDSRIGVGGSVPAGTVSSSAQITQFGFATTSSLAVVTPFLSSSIFNTFATSSNTFSASVNGTTSSLNTFSSSMNTFSASVNSTTSSLNRFTASAATTASNTFVGNQTVTGSLVVTSLTTISSSISANSSSLYLSSGSNLYIQNDGYFELSGSALVSGTFNIIGNSNLSTTASFNSLTASFNTFSSSINTTTASLNTFSSSINTFTSSYSTTSASFDSRINSITNGSGFVTTSSFNTFTSSVNSFTASVNASGSIINTFTSSINTSTSSLNSFSASVIATGSIINTFTSSLNTFTASVNASGSVINTFTSSVNSFSASVIATGSIINTFTSSVNSFSASVIATGSVINTFTASVNSATNSLNSYTSSNNTNITAIHTATSSLNTSTSSLNSFTSSINTTIKTKLDTDGVVSGSTQITNLGFAVTSSLPIVTPFLSSSIFNTFATSSNTFSSSINSTTSSLNSATSSIYSITSSFNLFTGSVNTFSSSVNSATASLNSKTGSYATTGSNRFNGNQTITGSLVVSGSVTINSGSITMPNRPAFRVTGTGGEIAAQTVLSGSKVTVDFNQGNHFNTTNGLFTAPIAGLYQVNLVVRTYSNTNSVINQVIVYKSGSNTGGDVTQIMVEFGTNTSMNHTGGSTISKLEVGDTLRAIVAVGSISFDVNDNFSVAYIG